MKRGIKLANMTIEQILALYAEVGIAQNAAERKGQIARFNRLADSNSKIIKELMSRPGDQRLALLQLYNHPDIQVRANAARDTWDVAQVESRRKLEELADSKWYPQAGEAGMNLSILEGKFERKPRSS